VEIEAVAKKLMGDFPLYAKNVLRIVDKRGEEKRFKLNYGQMILHEKLEKQLADTGRIRALVIKGRQMGISTYVEGRFFWKTTKTKNANAFVLSHLAESTTAIFRMVRYFYDNAAHPIFKPPLATSTTTTMVFEKLNSQYRIGTARSTNIGRGMTNRYVHASEAAFYPNSGEIVAGLLQSVPAEDSEVIVESTANGAGGWFYDQVMKALRGDGDWIVIFIPWFWLPEYEKKCDPYFTRTTEEEKLAALYNLSNDKLNWRRSKIDELGSLDLFKQEYPCTPEEAFLFSGRSFVEEDCLMDAERNCYSPDIEGSFKDGIVTPHEKGSYKQWIKRVDPDERYCIGVDVAEGLAHGDYTVAQVLDSLGRQVASWHLHIDPYELGDQLCALGKMFNRAYIIPERNNHGLTTIRRMQDLGYPNLYVEHTVDDAYADRMTKRAGFYTSSKTKPLIIDNLAALLRKRDSGISDTELVKELRNYVIDDKGITNAKAGCFDDRVMAYAIALFGLNSMPRNRRTKTVATKYEPFDSVVGY
jgi:hypothetical protein